MLKKGDTVVMHTCMEAQQHDGKVWTCRTDEQKLHPKHDFTVVWLEGFSGSFHVEFLQKVKVPAIGKKSREDSVDVIKEMLEGRVLNNEEFLALNLALIAFGE